MHLFSKENIWSNPHASSIHPDKYNNSVNRIISKEEERENPRRDSSIYLRVQNTVVFPHIIHPTRTTRTTVFPHAIQQLQVSTVNSTYRINSSTRNTPTTRLIPCHPVQIITRLLPLTVPHAPSILHGRIRLSRLLVQFPMQYSSPCSSPCFQFILPSRIALQAAASINTQPLQQFPGNPLGTTKNSIRRNRIHSKRVKYCMSMQY